MRIIKLSRQRCRNYKTNKEQITAVFFLLIVFLLFASKNIDLRNIIRNEDNQSNSNSKEDRFEKDTVVNDRIIITESQFDDSIMILDNDDEIYFLDSLNITEDELEEISPR